MTAEKDREVIQDESRDRFRGHSQGKSVLAAGSDVRLIAGGIGLLVGLGMFTGVAVGWMSGRMLSQVPNAETRPVHLSETVQEAWDRVSQLAQMDWRLPVHRVEKAAAPEAPPAPRAVEPAVAGLHVPVEVAALRFAEVKALSPHRSAVRADAERTVDALLQRFESIGFDISDLRAGGAGLEVPRLFVANLPIDIADVVLTEKRKRAFLKVMLPHVLRENERILEDRERLSRIFDRVALGLQPRDRDSQWLQDLAQKYGLDDVDLDELLLRVDIVPPALALAQAIEESGWGTSRFAQIGNAVFGQWTWTPGLGIVPENRPEGERYEVQRFSSLENSVAAYMRNLNAKSSYREFREKRAEMRRRDLTPDGYSLAAHLHRYSIRGADYIRGIRSIMRSNGLEAYDSAKLNKSPPSLLSGLDFLNKS